MEIHSLLGSGSYGNVYQIDHNNSQLALKTMTSKDKESVSSFLLEIINMKTLDHPNIIKCVDFELSNEKVEIYMIKYPISLLKYLHKYRDKNLYIGTLELNKMFMDILNGLDYLHTNDLLHLDLSDDNILMNENGRCIITDFGLSDISYEKRTIDGKNYLQKFPVFKCPFAAPEVLKEQFYNYTSDIWAFGVLMVRMLNYTYVFECLNDRVKQNSKINDYLKLDEEGKNNFIINCVKPREIDVDSVFTRKSEVRVTHLEIIKNIFQEDPNERPSASDIMIHLNRYENVWKTNTFHNEKHNLNTRRMLIEILNQDIFTDKISVVGNVLNSKFRDIKKYDLHLNHN